MQQPPQLDPHPMPTERPMPTLHPMAIFQPILSKPLTINNHPMPLQVAISPELFIRINMRTNQFPFNSIPFHQRPIPIQSILDIHLAQIDPLRLPQHKLWCRPQTLRA